VSPANCIGRAERKKAIYHRDHEAHDDVQMKNAVSPAIRIVHEGYPVIQ
jgi:hypothetical protein